MDHVIFPSGYAIPYTIFCGASVIKNAGTPNPCYDQSMNQPYHTSEQKTSRLFHYHYPCGRIIVRDDLRYGERSGCCRNSSDRKIDPPSRIGKIVPHTMTCVNGNRYCECFSYLFLVEKHPAVNCPEPT